MGVPVQNSTPKYTTFGTSKTSNALGSNTTAGNSLLAFIWINGSGSNPTISSLADAQSNPGWVQDFYGTPDADLNNIAIWRLPSVTTPGTAIVTAVMSANCYAEITVVEVPTLATSPVDGSHQNSGTNTTQPSTGTFSTAGLNDIIFATFADEVFTSVTSPSGFTLIATDTSGTRTTGTLAYKSVTSAQSGINPTWSAMPSNGDKWLAAGIGYKFPSAAPASHGGGMSGMSGMSGLSGIFG